MSCSFVVLTGAGGSGKANAVHVTGAEVLFAVSLVPEVEF